MEFTHFISECQRLFALNGLSCTEEQAEKLYQLTIRMLDVNQRMNLTAITEEKSVILRHYVDSITISSSIPRGSQVIDIGCGAGFPTLPLAIFRPDLTITALDGTAKRIRYVEETAKLLGLENVTAIAGRAEEYANDPRYREKYDVVTARAVAALPVLCELCLGFVRVGGVMLAMKSQQAEEELMASRDAIHLCGGKLSQKIDCTLRQETGDPEQRLLLVIEKTTLTPKIYPRHFSKISKNPL